MMPVSRCFLLLMACCVVSTASIANNLGVWGAVYPISEMDFLRFIHDRLVSFKKTGKLKRYEQAFLHRVKAHTLRPHPVSNITTIRKNKIFYYDPTFVLPHALRNASGKVLVPSGIQVNPLREITLRETLLFINGDDARQIHWVREKIKEQTQFKIILVKGNIKVSTKALNNRVYFDQNGFITHQLRIQHVPAMVMQAGDRLKINEIAIAPWAASHMGEN